MKIVLIGTSAYCVVGFRADLIKLMVAQGHTVYAYALDYDPQTQAQVCALGAIPVAYTFSRTGLNPLKDLINTLLLSRRIRRDQPDLVLSYFAKPSIFGTLAAVWAGVKYRHAMLEGLGYVFTEQPAGNSLKTRLLKAAQIMLYRRIFPYLDSLLLLNQDDKKDLIDHYAIPVKQTHVLGAIGLNLAEYPMRPLVPGAVSFIFIARLLAEKGVHDYLAAARQVKQRYPQTQFYMLGALDHDNPGSLTRQQLAGVVAEKLVIYPGHVSNVADWLAKAHVFVLPSYYREGIPRSTQEAMAMGRPVLTTDVPGCRETVQQGVNGFLVPKWSPEVLAEKMLYLIEHPEQLQEMGQQSARLARQKFDADQVNQRLLDLLNISARS